MKVFLNQTGDPWMDWGLAAFVQLAEENDLVFSSQVISNGLNLNIEDVDEAVLIVLNYLQQQLDRIVLLPPEAKLLGYQHRREENGFYDPSQSWHLSKQEEEQASEVFLAQHAAMAKRWGREKEYKPPQFKPNTNLLVTLKRNYPGLKKDWRKLTQGFEEEVTAFFQQHSQDGTKEKSCCLCGRGAQTDYPMRQNKNPFYNQHHNNKVRGHMSSVSVNSMCPTCNFLNLFAAISADLPYFVEGHTHVLVPQVDDISTLVEIRRLVRNSSLDLDSPTVMSFRTNIPGLPSRQADLYTSLVGIYWNLKYKYKWNPLQNVEEWGFGLSPEQQRQVERWIVFRYSKGQNVIFAHFNLLRVKSRLFKLLERIRYGQDGEREGDLYRNLLRTFPIGNGRAREDFSYGIVMGDWRSVAAALFNLFKEGGVINTFFAAEFFNYGLEVDNLLSAELLEDVRKVATTIGRVFAKDVGMMSALNNAHDEASLRKVLKDVFVKMHKIAATSSRSGGDDELWVPGTERVENILSSVTRENVAEIRDTMLIYATLMAMNRLRDGNKENKGGSEQ